MLIIPANPQEKHSYIYSDFPSMAQNWHWQLGSRPS